LASGNSCLNEAVPGSFSWTGADICSRSTCQDGVFTPGACPASCDASVVLANAVGLGDCSNVLPSGGSCLNSAATGGDFCSWSTCQDGVFTPGACPAFCDASVVLANAVGMGDCSDVLASGDSCLNDAVPGGDACSPSTCQDGVFNPGACPAFCDASVVLANAVGLGDCSNVLASGGSCLNDGVPGGDLCSYSTCQDGMFTPGACPEPCDASKILQNARNLGTCSAVLASGLSCKNAAISGFICELSTCSNGILTPGICFEKNYMTNAKIRNAVLAWMESPSAATNLYGHIRDWNTGNVTDLSELFCAEPSFCESWHFGAQNFDEDLSRWNVARVIDMTSMFRGAKKFDVDTVNTWDVTAVEDMTGIFSNVPHQSVCGISWLYSEATGIESVSLGSRGAPCCSVGSAAACCIEEPCPLDVCAELPSGFYCEDGKAFRCPTQADTLCFQGTVQKITALGSFEVNGNLRSCMPGFYCPGDLEQYACEAGKYTALPLSFSCFSCPRGQVSNKLLKSTGCDACPLGTVEVNSVECRTCRPGFFCSTPASETPCQRGTFCPEGSILPANVPVGHYSVDLHGEPVLEGASAEKECPAGWYCFNADISRCEGTETASPTAHPTLAPTILFPTPNPSLAPTTTNTPSAPGTTSPTVKPTVAPTGFHRPSLL
jgi:hypothetical protein